MTGVDIEVGMGVIVNEPGPNDLWNHEFIGSIKAIREEDGEETIFTIEDADGDCFDMTADQFEPQED
jgi:hypothetical protein